MFLKSKGLSACVHNHAVNYLHSFITELDCFDRDTDFTLTFHELSGISEAAENPYGEDDSKSPFPVQPQVKRSYAQNVTVWIKASGLQVQKNHSTKSTVCLSPRRSDGWFQFLQGVFGV